MRRSFRALFPVICISLFGCGGAGGGGNATSPIDPVSPTEKGTARFDVRVTTGKVEITPLETASSKSAVLGGSAVSFETSTLLAEGGEVGRRAVKVRLKNNLPEAIGVGRPIRIQFGVFGPSTSFPTDLRNQATVSTPVIDPTGGFLDGPVGTALLTNPSAVTVGKDGSIYFNGTDNRIRRLADGYVSTVAQNLPASSLAYLSDAVTGREYLVAACPSLHSVKLVPVASGSVTTWAGADSAPGNVNGAATTARFNAPTGVGIDASLNQVLAADTSNGAIRAIPFSFVGGNLVAGTVSTRYSGLTSPTSVHVSENRSVAVSETSLNRIRIYNAGSSREAIFGGTADNVNGDGNLARFSAPRGITSIGNTFYVADGNNYQLRRIKLKDGAAPLLAANWTVSVLAGAGASAFADGTGAEAYFGNITGLATDTQGRLVVADGGSNAIRRVTSQGSFDFGTPTGASVGQANLTNPTGFVDLNGLQRPYIDIDSRVEPGQTIDIGQWIFSIPEGLTSFNFSVTVEAAPETYAGLEAVLNPAGGPGSPNVVAQFLSRSGNDYSATGRIENVTFGRGAAMAIDRNGNIFATDLLNLVIRRIAKDGTVTLVAGRVGTGGTANGVGSVARFSGPFGIHCNPEGTELIVSDSQGNTIRRVALIVDTADPKEIDNWQVTTIAGGAAGGGTNGPGNVASLSSPGSLAGPSNDTLYFVEEPTHKIRLLTYAGGPRSAATSWNVQYVAGSTTGGAGYVDGLASLSLFNRPTAIAYSPDGIYYITDSFNHRIRALNPATNQVSTVAGNGVAGDSDHEDALLGQLQNVNTLAVDASGAIYISSDRRVRRLYNGALKTVAGGGTTAETTGDKILFTDQLSGFAIDSKGDLIFETNRRLVRLTRKLGR